MKCERAREALSLYVGGDLPAAEELTRTNAHLRECADCRQFHESLAHNQSMLRSLRQTAVAPAVLDAMRQELLPRLAASRPGWWIRFERFVFAEAWAHRFAIAGAAIVAIVSVTLFAQMRQVTATSNVAVFESPDTLHLPEDYRNWVVLGKATEAPHSGNVYMNPAAYGEYRRSGKFPEGTVMVVESKASEAGNGITVEASVKDRRFSEGWGYFRFAETEAGMAFKAQALPVAAGCLACHRDRAATDHVFTQFYSVLRSASGVQI
jgi:hypothetical protein